MTKKNPRDTDKKPSEMFMRSLRGFGSGSPDMECGWCGRLHLCPESESYRGDDDGGAGWREECEQQFKENPDNVVLHWDWDCVTGHELNSIQFVDDCPCNGITRYETFIWNERATIREYLKNRVDQEYQWAQEEKTLNVLAGFDDDKKEAFYR